MSSTKKHAKKKPLHEYPERVVGTELLAHIGMESNRKNGIHCLDDNTLIAAAGNVVLFLDLRDGSIRADQGPELGGIGAVCAHPSKPLFVICEKGNDPLVRVHEWPSKRRLHVMKNGAVQGFSACTFNEKGQFLATVAIEPDYVITVWDWQQQAIVLRNKAFGSDVFNIVFNPFNEGLMVTSGMGHIKFWTMAQTFTGLKLQGEVGKFGRLEISDVSAAVCLPDGKVVSGSESGSLLLWEGSLIKAELYNLTATQAKLKALEDQALIDGTPTENLKVDKVRCHTGPIEVMKMLANGKIIMSAGHDGYIRYWSADEIDGAEGDGTDPSCGVHLLKEYYVGDNIAINAATLTPSKSCWVLQDAKGSILKAPYWSYEVILSSAPPPEFRTDGPIAKFSAGALHHVLASPTDHTAVTLGDDGSVRLIDYLRSKELYNVIFDSAAVKGKFLSMETGDRDGRTLVVAFKNGTLRVLRKAQNTFELLSICRPHNTRIIDFSIDLASKQILTISEDGTAFFLRLKPLEFQLEPVGYCQLPAKATSCCWTTESTSCLISFTNGNIIALETPKPTDVDTSISFEFKPRWAGIGYRQKMKPPEKPKKEGVDDEDEEEEHDELEEEDLGPWGVHFISPTPHRTYIIGIDNKELCYEYECKIRYDGREGPTPLPATGIEPPNWVEEPMRNHAFRDTIVYGMGTTHSGQYYLCICEKNQLLIRSYNQPDKILHSTQLHDAIHGRTTAATLSFDDKVLLTSATDGMLFVHRIQDITPPTTMDGANLSRLPVAKPPSNLAVARSVEEQKKYDDERRAEEAAQGKKAQTLNRIRAIHEEYELVLKNNQEAKEGAQLSYEEMLLDKDLYAILDKELAKAVDDASIEFSWETAKREVKLKKLRDAFVDSLIYDHFAVTGLQSDVRVASFRTPHFNEHQKKALETIQELLRKEEENAAAEAEDAADADDIGSNANGPKSPNAKSSTHASNFSSPRSPTNNRSFPSGGQNPQSPTHSDPKKEQPELPTQLNQSKKEASKSGVKSQLEKAEERKRERVERRKGYQALLARRPRQQDEDPKYLQEILRAEKFMGDFILKSSPEYSIPEHARPTADRKTKQLILLEHSIVQLRSEFNQRLLAMRDLKARLCEQLNQDRAKIKAISHLLNQDQDFVPFSLSLEEQPEKRFETTHAELERFEREQAKAKKREEAMLKAKKGFGGDLAQTQNDDEEEDHALMSQKSIRGPQQGTQGAQRRLSNMSNLRERTDADVKARVDAVKRSDLEEEEAAANREQLLFERASLERRVNKTISAFDEALFDLFNEKLRLEADLTMADMRVLLLFREFQLLSEFKKQDEDLQKKLMGKKKERQDVLDRREALNQQRAAKLVDLKALNSAMDSLSQDVAALLATVPEAKPALEKIYNRRIKRRRKDDADDDADDDLSSSDDDEEEIVEEDDADAGVEDVCPPGCAESVYQQVLQLRERRLDQDEIFDKHNEDEEKAKATLNDLKTKEDKLTGEVRAVEKEVELFQIKKQKELNLLTTVVVLKLSQIQCLDQEGRIPHKYGDNIVVFSQSGLESLRRRIMELAEQKHQKRKEVETLGVEKARITRRKSKKQAEHAEWEAKVYEVQLLKFGQRVDLEMLENVAVDRETEELKERLKLEEVKWEKELNKQTSKLADLKADQQARITDNTILLKDLGSLRAEQHDVEEKLGQSTHKVVAKMYGGSKVATAADRAHLKDLVVAQQQEIDALKNEIAMLRRKGGHVYTPVVNPAKTV